MAMKLVFCGTPGFGLPSLRRLISDSRFQIAAVVTQPDRPRGRGNRIKTSAVKDFALESGLYIYQPEKIREESANSFFRRINPDAVVIIAYGQIIPQRLIDIPKLGWINLHASLLPKYRGAAPINWAIANGESRTGVTTMQIDAGMDTGPILQQGETSIRPDETAPELSRRLAELGADLVIDSLFGLDSGKVVPRPQDNSQSSKAPLLKKEFGQIDWALSAKKIYDRIRGFDPWPGAFTFFRGSLCRVWGRPAVASSTASGAGTLAAPGTIETVGENLDVLCGHDSHLRLDIVQLQGKTRVTAKEFAHGAHLKKGDLFTSQTLLPKPTS